ncbi:ArsB/NhaD family transporter [Streptomyces sp. NPDC047117]|uniref:ArsB/NhaD family transporter n=1 Tax=Streptomyces sp. NPDC047117 TaxID=3155379 RepID=UPI0033C6E6A8
MNTPLAEALSAALLVVVLVCAVVRPFRLPEAAVAVPAAVVVIAAGAIPPAHARAEAARLGPVVGFLAAVLVPARLCADEGLFEACGAWMARVAAGRPRRLLAAVFVPALGIVVRAVVDNGLADVLGRLVPDGSSLSALLGAAAPAAVPANVINNLPAVLVLVPPAAPAGSGAVLAVLLGVNIGPNLTYAGSLATLLWRRILHAHDTDVVLRDFTRLGPMTVPATLSLAVVAPWGSLQLFGG